jgi:hypothetical protein
VTSNWVNENGNPSVKWKGHSLTRLREIDQRLSEAFGAEQVARRAIATARKEREEYVSGLVDLPPESISIGGHNCPESPTRTCVYNDAEDPCHDQCIICQEPSERK